MPSTRARRSRVPSRSPVTGSVITASAPWRQAAQRFWSIRHDSAAGIGSSANRVASACATVATGQDAEAGQFVTWVNNVSEHYRYR